ncbi:MAG TPA: trigger factor [Nitrolancea sp.]
MKVTVERMPQSSVSLDIVAESDEFDKAMDKAYRKISRQVRIPGFRPGKAPRLIVEQRLGREVIVEEAQREIMDGLYRQALEQEELTPVSEPSVDVYQDEPIGFKVEVQIYPTVDLNEYTDVRVESQEINVSDEDVDEAISDIQKQNSVWKEPESQRSPRAGDQVIIDLQAYEGEEPFQDAVEDAEFEIGEGRLFPQIEEALKNVSAGEQAEFDITFDEDDEKANPDLRGKTLHYKVTLKEIKERELPEIDDELAKTAGYDTLDEMRDTLRKNLLRTRAFQARTEVVNDAIQSVADQAILDVPSAMVVRQIDEDIARLQQELSREGMSFDEFLRFGNKTIEEYRDELKPDAERRLRNSLVLEAFAKAENVEVGEDDLLAEIDRLVGPAENAEQMRELYTNPYFSNMLRDELANRKVADRLLEIVTEGVGAVTGEGATVFNEPEAVEESNENDDEEVLTSDAESSDDNADSDDRDEADDDVEQTAAADTEAEEAAVAATAADENDTTDREPTGS